MNNSTKILLVLAAGWMATTIQAQTPQDRIHYTGKELSNPTYHDGQLSPVVGVHNIQLVRANREHPEGARTAKRHTGSVERQWMDLQPSAYAGLLERSVLLSVSGRSVR